MYWTLTATLHWINTGNLFHENVLEHILWKCMYKSYPKWHCWCDVGFCCNRYDPFKLGWFQADAGAEITAMGLLPDTPNCELRMRRECRGRFLATARAWRTCRDACQDRYLAVSFEVGGGKTTPGIPGACATRNMAYLVRAPWKQPWRTYIDMNPTKPHEWMI